MIDQLGRPDPPARLAAGMVDQRVVIPDDAVRHAADNGGDFLLLGFIRDQVMKEIPGEIVPVELVAAGVALAPEAGSCR